VSASPTKQPAESEPVILLNAAVSADAVYDLPAIRRDDPETAQASEDSCGAWSVSEAGMEAILQEMVRQGWTPPARFDALALSQPADRSPIEALDPDSPALPVFEEPDSGKPARDPQDLRADRQDNWRYVQDAERFLNSPKRMSGCIRGSAAWMNLVSSITF
jgi:hypothetical protein